MPALTIAEKVAALELIVGDWTTPPVLASGGKPKELINGKYDLKESDYQLHAALDGLVGTPTTEGLVPKLARLIAEQAATISELRDRIDQLPTGGTSGTPFPAGTQVIDGDVVFKGRVGFGALHPNGKAQVHIVGDDASILFVSNVSGGQWQNASPHVAEVSLAADGGIRTLQNAMNTLDTRTATDPDANPPRTFQSNYKDFVDPTREVAQFGLDSRSQLSLMRKEPGKSHEYTQDLVFKIYEDQKIIALESWRRGWNIKFGVDAKYGPARFSAEQV